MGNIFLQIARATLLTVVVSLAASAVGCGREQAPASPGPRAQSQLPAAAAGSAKPPPVEDAAAVRAGQRAKQSPATPRTPPRAPVPTLGDLIAQPASDPTVTNPPPAPADEPKIDDERVAAHGIRKLSGKHLVLYTDLPSAPDVDELPRVFDAIVPQWQAYFAVHAPAVEKWRLTGYLIRDKQKFIDAGLFPPDLPDFPNGYQRGAEFWLYEQPSPYYRRHLLLHEGTHAFMYHWLGGAGPPWYCEGMAELFGTHRWVDGKLTTAYMPPDKDQVPHWGRIKLIKDAYDGGKALTLADVLKLPPDAHRLTEAYAWSWAAAAFLDGHPRYRGAFRDMSRHARSTGTEFSTQLLSSLKADVPLLLDEWQLFVGHCEYGYDVARNALDSKPAVDLPPAGAKAQIAADRGWQSTGFKLLAGQTYRIEAAGRYQIAANPKVWWCEPDGVTIRYHRGKPLGRLLGALRDDERSQTPTPLLNPVSIGVSATITPDKDATLWLNINDHEAELADNAGELEVTITPQTP